jgi:hypothetical protein
MKNDEPLIHVISLDELYFFLKVALFYFFTTIAKLNLVISYRLSKLFIFI